MSEKRRGRKSEDVKSVTTKNPKKNTLSAATPQVLAREQKEDQSLDKVDDEGDYLDAEEESDPSEIWGESGEDEEMEAPATKRKTRPDHAIVPAGTSIEIAESEVQAISPSDPLRRYLDEVRHHSLLEPEEEFQLALRLRDTGDIHAAKRLVQANLRLVVKIALEYRNFYSNILDLIQEGNIGLMKAVSKFDPTRGARLGYYSSWWIRSYILKYLLDNFRLVKIGTTQAQKKLFYHLLREKERLEAQGLLAGPKLLAEKLDVREKDVIEMEQRLSSRGSEVSIDTPSDPENPGSSVSSHLADEREGAEESLAKNQLLQLLEGKLPEFQKQLDEKESRILKERLLAEDPKTLQEVADLYGLTRERARQIEAKVIKKLRDFLAPFLGELDDE